MFKLLVKDIQITKIKMEKVENMKKEMGNFSKHMEIIKENQGKDIQLNKLLSVRSIKIN